MLVDWLFLFAGRMVYLLNCLFVELRDEGKGKVAGGKKHEFMNQE